MTGPAETYRTQLIAAVARGLGEPDNADLLEEVGTWTDEDLLDLVFKNGWALSPEQLSEKPAELPPEPEPPPEPEIEQETPAPAKAPAREPVGAVEPPGKPTGGVRAGKSKRTVISANGGLDKDTFIPFGPFPKWCTWRIRKAMTKNELSLFITACEEADGTTGVFHMGRVRAGQVLGGGPTVGRRAIDGLLAGGLWFKRSSGANNRRGGRGIETAYQIAAGSTIDEDRVIAALDAFHSARPDIRKLCERAAMTVVAAAGADATA